MVHKFSMCIYNALRIAKNDSIMKLTGTWCSAPGGHDWDGKAVNMPQQTTVAVLSTSLIATRS